MESKQNGDGVWDVVVVGGGFSGLSAALYAAERGAKVVVLEARDRVGGRIKTEIHQGIPVDVGGAYVGPTQNRILRMADRYGIETYKVKTEGTSVALVNGQWSTSRATGALPPVSPLALLDLNNLYRMTYDLGDKVSLDTPWSADQAGKWDGMTVAEWANKHAWTAGGKDMFNITVRAIVAAEPTEVSLLYWLWYVKSGGGINRTMDADNGAQERKILGGAMSIADAMARELGQNVVLSTPVSHIAQDRNGVTVLARDGRQFRGRYLVLAMAPALYNKFTFEPALPSVRSGLASRIPMGCVIKTTIYYERAWWRDAGYSGIMLCDEGPVMSTFDDTKPDGSHPAIMGFVLAKQAREFAALSQQDRCRVVAEQYARVWKCEDALHPIAYVDKNWQEEEFSGGCFVGIMGPGVMTEAGAMLRSSFQRIHFAGTETATQWAGYMDGAIESGERAAHEVIVRLAADGRKVTMSAPPPKVEPDSPKVPSTPSGMSITERILPSPAAALGGSVSTMAAVAAGLWVRSRL